MTLLHIYPKRFFLRSNELSDARVVSLIKKEIGSAVHFFINLHKFLKVNI